jgi:phosphatidylserine/phosphatidylglycerophosphate/cardiolipin synthase-like enzyme
MARIHAFPLLLLICVTFACTTPGGNLIERPDYSGSRDVPDAGRDVQSFDPGDQDRPAPDDEGFDATPADPGTTDPGTDPGTPPTPVRLVTDKAALSAIVGLVDGAMTSLQMVELEFIDGWAPNTVRDALVRAAARGVRVQVLMESDVEKNDPRLTELTGAGIEARLDGASRTLHTKLVVADRTRALVGSTNLSTSSLNYNHEANLALDGAALAEPFAAYADALWSKPAQTAAIPAIPVSGVTPIGDGQYDAQARTHLAAATRRVLLVLYHMSDDWSGDVGDIAQAVIDARARGLEVRVVLESTAYETYVNDQNKACGQRLSAADVQVRYNDVDTLTHTKMLVTDDVVAVHSGNWVYSSFNSNHEAGAIVDVPGVTADAITTFEKIWSESVP